MNRGITMMAIAGAFWANAAFAEPMERASLDEAARSPHVVLASYQDFQPATGRSDEDIYFSGIKATYKIESILKQPQKGSRDTAIPIEAGKKADVKYIMHDLSPCLVDETFHFSERLMPKKGSKWILFLQMKDTNNDWHTYRGEVGRMEATEANIKRVKALIN